MDAIKYESHNGIVEYRLPNGVLHREDGPALIYPNGPAYWYLFGNLHREDGPAITGIDGTNRWYSHGLRHRIDGPSVVYAGGEVEYWINDIQYDPITFLIKNYELINKI